MNIEKCMKSAIEYVKLPSPRWLQSASDLTPEGKLKEFVEWKYTPIIPEYAFQSLINKFKEEVVRELGEEVLKKLGI